MTKAVVLVLAFCACKRAANIRVSAPVGTRLAIALRDTQSGGGVLSLVDVASRDEKQVGLSTQMNVAPLAVSYASGGAGYFFVLTASPTQLLAWAANGQELSNRPDGTFALSGFIPSGVVGTAGGALVYSRDVASEPRAAVWRPATGEIKRVAAFSSPALVASIACALDDAHFALLGTAPVQGMNSLPDELALVDIDGAMVGRFSVRSYADAFSAELTGAAGCVSHAGSGLVALVFATSSNVLLLRRAGDVLQGVRVVALTPGLSFAERLTPQFVPNGSALVVPARASEDMAIVPIDGAPAGRIRTPFAGIPRALAPLPGVDGLLVGLRGTDSARVALHFFEGSEDINLIELGATDEVVDMVTAAPGE